MSDSPEDLSPLMGQNVVLDVVAQYVYIGRLAGSDHKYLVLEEADVHDLRDTTTTRELYVLDSRRHGVSVNRQRVLVSRDQIVSLSALDDVVM
ncbi:hypothetical protein [Maioricimonas sp. JC845]|uniref:hypothetical protein n=1 Tax=Maioricimonas sp. JC845 TaxID=3232138 RepID=UPI003457438F